MGDLCIFKSRFCSLQTARVAEKLLPQNIDCVKQKLSNNQQATITSAHAVRKYGPVLLRYGQFTSTEIEG